MKKKIAFQFIVVLLFFLGTLLVLLPFLKTALISYQIETTVIHQTNSIPNNIEEKREWIQPPTLGDVLKSFTVDSNFSSVGRVVVPEVEINTPVFNELTNENLLVGSGVMFPDRDPEKENMVLVGHHLSDKGLLFGSLSTVKIGSPIYLEYLNNYYYYVIDEVINVKDTAVEVMDNRGKAEITLITCDKPSYTDRRVVVKGHLMDNKTDMQIHKQIETAQTKRIGYQKKSLVFFNEFKLIILITVFVLFLSTYMVRKFI
ncbi:class A sortase [Enterococcus rivorum]|uniref:Class A sortase n=1 Tax=Enterococcus rivorum TaxID=762845 RepID=A0A1E5KWP7_9ENTE|nr:class A sortase [Enterococcus rivorum]MBP2099138.1 sortase A [Enterococcus rivorum]OEH82287.1 hypothetical protein BCR26_13645 [Enterococcus rivorum]